MDQETSNTPMKQALKRFLPGPVWQTASDVRYTIQRAALWPQATFHPWRRASIRRLAEFKDRHRGQRCFVIGNGPSLKQTDLTKLRNEVTYGMNRIYLAFPELGFGTTYYVCINSLVIEQCAEDIRGLPMPKFLSWRSRNLIPPQKDNEDLIFLHTTYTGPKFAQDVRGRLWEGATV